MSTLTKQRATLHGGRCIVKNGKTTSTPFSSKHSDRNFDVRNASHIEPERLNENTYYIITADGAIKPCDKGISFESHELLMYETYYGEWLSKLNDRYVKDGHANRQRTMKDVIKSARQAPREEILSIGNCNDRCKDDGEFETVVMEYITELQRKYPRVKPLTLSFHRDEEANLHCHLRETFAADKNGDDEPNQTAALLQMGIQAPNPDKKSDRWNHPLVTYTQECRELFIEIAEAHGFHIEREVASPGKTTLNKQEYLTKVLREEKAELTAQCDALQRENGRLETERAALITGSEELKLENQELQKKNLVLTNENSRLRKILHGLKQIFCPIQKLFSRLNSIRLNETKTLLDEIYLNAKTAGCYSALKALETGDFSNIDEESSVDYGLEHDFERC